MITMTLIALLALSIGVHAIGFALRCLGGVMRLAFGLFGLLILPLALLFSLAWGLGRIVLPVLLVLLVLQLAFPREA